MFTHHITFIIDIKSFPENSEDDWTIFFEFETTRHVLSEMRQVSSVRQLQITNKLFLQIFQWFQSSEFLEEMFL